MELNLEDLCVGYLTQAGTKINVGYIIFYQHSPAVSYPYLLFYDVFRCYVQVLHVINLCHVIKYKQVR